MFFPRTTQEESNRVSFNYDRRKVTRSSQMLLSNITRTLALETIFQICFISVNWNIEKQPPQEIVGANLTTKIQSVQCLNLVNRMMQLRGQRECSALKATLVE